MQNPTPKFDTPQSDSRLLRSDFGTGQSQELNPFTHRPAPPTLPVEHLPDSFSEAKIFAPRPIEQVPTQFNNSTGTTAFSNGLFASSANPVSLETSVPPPAAWQPPVLEEQPPAILPKPSLWQRLHARPMKVAASFTLLLILATGIFSLLNRSTSPDQVASQNTADSSLFSPKDSKIVLSLDTTIEGKLGIGTAPTGEAELQVAGDIQSAGGLFVSGGSSSLSDSGLIINTITVCTTAGCTAASSASSAGGAGVAGATGPAGATGATGPKGDTGDAMCSSGCVLLQSSSPGSTQTGHIHVSGDIIANGLTGDGTNVNNVNALTLQGNSAAFFTNASNISSGTLADARLSSNVSLFGSSVDSSEITNDSITNTDINSAAAIVYSKLNLNGSIVNADVSNSAAIAYAKLSLANSITNGDLAGSIADSKLLTISTVGKVADSALSASVSLLGQTIDSAEISNDSIVDADVNSAAAIAWSKISKVGSSLADLITRSASDLSSGTLDDARLSANVAKLDGTGPQTFTGNNRFNGTLLQRNDSPSAFQVQNAAGTSNLLVADTSNTRIGVGALPATALLTIGTDTTTAAGGLYFGTDTNLYRLAADVLATDDQFRVIRASGGSSALVARVSGDGNNRFALQADGALQWGDGTASADTNLYRSAANVLKTDDQLQVAGGIKILYASDDALHNWDLAVTGTDAFTLRVSGDTSNRFNIEADGRLIWGAGSGAPDTNLYRSSSDTLKTDDSLIVAGSSGVRIDGIAAGDPSLRLLLNSSDANAAYRIEGDGKTWWGAGGASAVDTNLYRSAASQLKSDDSFLIQADAATVFQVQKADTTSLFIVDSSNSRLAIGPSAVAANAVLTIGTNTTTASGGLYFGTDTNLYRSAANTLKSDDRLIYKATGAFSAYRNAAFSTTASNQFKIPYDSEEFDSDSWFDSTTNNRYTPQIAGYYRLNASLCLSTGQADTERLAIYIYKNGALFKLMHFDNASSGDDNSCVSGTTTVLANGSSDYFEAFGYTSAVESARTGTAYTIFQGEFIGTD